MRIIKLKGCMKNKIKIKKDGSYFGRKIMSATMCALLMLQPLSGVFALDVSDEDNEDINEEYTETAYEEMNIEIKYTETVYKGADYSWYISAGTGASSYTVADAASLKGFANLVNGTDLPEDEMTVTIEDGTVRSAVLSQTDFAGKTVTLINDIDLSELDGADNDNDSSVGNEVDDGKDTAEDQNGSGNNDTKLLSGWMPVGTLETPFRGIFDGHGRSIKGLKVTDDDLTGGTAAGLFGYASGEIRNVTLKGSIDISGSTDVDAGILAGVLTGKASNINVNGNISILNGNAGGVAGSAENGALIERAVSDVSVNTGADASAAGIAGCGAAGASVRDSYNTGCISSKGAAAGIDAGEASVTGCFNTGAVNGTQRADVIGGIAYNCFAIEGCISDDTGSTGSDVTETGEAEASGVTIATADAFNDGRVAWKLNTASGTQKNSETWTQGESHPDLVKEGTSGAVYRLVMSISSGIDVTARYSSDDAENSGVVGSEKVENDSENDNNSTLKNNVINYYYVKGKTIELVAVPDDADDDSDSSDIKHSVDLAYAFIKDSMGRTVFSASTKKFATDGLILTCSPEADQMSGEVLTYAAAEADEKVSITFDGNGGCFGGDAGTTSDIMSIAYGTFMSEAIYDEDAPEYSDGPAEFTGWYVDRMCSIPVDGNAILVKDMTLYAGWIKQCDITFDLNGYEGNEDVSDWPLVIRMYTGSTVDEQKAPLWTSTSNDDGTITRHNFIGWFTEPEGGEAWNFDMPVNDSMTLYAHWEHVSAERPSSSGGVTSISGGESFQKLLGTIQDGMSYKGQTITFDEDITLEDAVVISSFDGILDGQGHTLTLNTKQFTSTGNMTALFRELKNGAEVRNINIVYDGGTVSSSAKFAVLCDTNHGTIENCTLKLSIHRTGSGNGFGGSFVRVNSTNGVVSRCTLMSGSSISFNGSYGGIIGENSGKVDNCLVDKNVSISASGSAGGIVYRLVSAASEIPGVSGNEDEDPGEKGEDADSDKTQPDGGATIVTNCSVNADITSDTGTGKNSVKNYAGGIAAEMTLEDGNVSIEKCIYDGKLSGRGAAGGIAGIMYGGRGDGESYTSVTNACYAGGSVSGAAAIGGVVGVLRSGTVNFCYSTADLTGAYEYLGGIAGAAGNSIVDAIYDKSAMQDKEAGEAVIDSTYWFGSIFSADRGASLGMFCGGDLDDADVKNCYFGTADDSVVCTSDAHMSDEAATAAVKTAAEFADGTVAWDLETRGGTQKEHAKRFSMNTKPGNSSKAALSSDSENSDTYVFVRDADNYTSPVLSSDSIYRIEATFDESTDQNVSYDKTKDYININVGKIVVRAYGGAAAADGEEINEGQDTDNVSENTPENSNAAALYMYGSGTLQWREYSRDLHFALNELINRLEEDGEYDKYSVISTYDVSISDMDGNVLDTYHSQSLDVLGRTGEYKLGGYDLKIDANVFKSITEEKVIEPDEDKKDDEQQKPSDSKHHHSSSGSTSTGNGNGGSGTNEDATGRNDGDGMNDSGAPARPEPTVPVISEEPDEQITLTLPIEQTAQNASDVETDEPDAEAELAQQAAPDNADSPRNEEKKQEQSEPEQADQAKSQTVFEVIRHSVEENPVSLIAVVFMIIAIVAAAAVHRIRRSR